MSIMKKTAGAKACGKKRYMIRRQLAALLAAVMMTACCGGSAVHAAAFPAHDHTPAPAVQAVNESSALPPLPIGYFGGDAPLYFRQIVRLINLIIFGAEADVQGGGLSGEVRETIYDSNPDIGIMKDPEAEGEPRPRASRGAFRVMQQGILGADEQH